MTRSWFFCYLRIKDRKGVIKLKKIIAGIIGVLAIMAVTAGTAYAIFSTTATVSGITMSTGSASLDIRDSGTETPVTWSSYATFLSGRLQNLYPGKVDYTTMLFKNNSSSDIGLNLSAQLTGISGDGWGYLYDKILMVVVKDNGGIYSSDNVPDGNAGWHTLGEWSSSSIRFGEVLAHGDPRDTYKVFIKVLDSADNTIAGKSFSGNLVFTGTQPQ